MKVLMLAALVTTSVFAQDPATYLKNFDAKIYSLKTKGVQDFVVDIESSRLTKQVNDAQTFGKVKDLVFRVYWTAQPDRMAVEVVGLPEGFKEVKEELKASILPAIEQLLPPTMTQIYHGYKFSPGQKPKEIIAQDATGLAPVPSYVLKFDQQDRLVETVANKTIGTLVTTHKYEKDSFADGKWVMKEQVSKASENGNNLTVTKSVSWDKEQGIGVVSEVEISVEQKLADPKAPKVQKSDSFEFENYKINTGAALKYFLGETAGKK